MTAPRDFEAMRIRLPVDPLRMPATLRVVPLEGVEVTESDETGWAAWDIAVQQQDRRE